MFCYKELFLKISHFHKKAPVSESLFNKIADLKACSFIKKRLQHRCFPVNFAKFLRTPILKNICKQLSFVRKIFMTRYREKGQFNPFRVNVLNYFKKQPPEVFYKKGVLKDFSEFTGKHLCPSLFFNKVADQRRNCVLDVSQLFVTYLER